MNNVNQASNIADFVMVVGPDGTSPASGVDPVLDAYNVDVIIDYSQDPQQHGGPLPDYENTGIGGPDIDEKVNGYTWDEKTGKWIDTAAAQAKEAAGSNRMILIGIGIAIAVIAIIIVASSGTAKAAA